MTIRRHFLLASIELWVAIFLAGCLMFLPFRHALFPGIPAMRLVAYSLLCPLMLILALFVLEFGERAFEWRLVGAGLVKKRKGPPNEEIKRIDLGQVLRFRARREVPFVGRTWTLSVTMHEIVEQPPVYFEFLGVKLTGSTGGHRIHCLYFLSKPDKDRVVSAIDSATKADAGTYGSTMLPQRQK